MRPVQLSMTAFGPYAGTEVVDFDALADLGLFSVAGSNGSGKTTIFDGLFFALYGSLPGRRSSYYRLKSDHAPADVECRVELDFVANGEHWRIERFPKQITPKKRGTGTTQRDQRATLFRVVDGVAQAVVNRIREVDARCVELVGLSGPQFERVALLPQGEFSRMLREGGESRRKLLRTLFSSEVFGEATKILVDVAAQVGRDHEIASISVHEQLDRVAAEVAALSVDPSPQGQQQPQGHTAETSEPAGPGHHGIDLVDKPDAGTRPVEASAGPDRVLGHQIDPALVAQSIGRFEANDLAKLGTQVDRLRELASYHAIEVQRARGVLDHIERQAAVAATFKDHLASGNNVERDLERLDAARAAVPVVAMAQVARRQAEAHSDSALRVAELQNRLAPLLSQFVSDDSVPNDTTALNAAAVAIEAHVKRLGEIVEASEQVARLQTVVGDLEAEQTRLVRDEQTLRAEREQLDSRRLSLEAQRDRFKAQSDRETALREFKSVTARADQRARLRELDNGHELARAEAHKLAEARSRIEVKLGDAERARDRQAVCNDTARAATERLADLHELQAARQRFDHVVALLGPARQARARAEAEHDQRFDAFVRGTSTRLAKVLIDGEPCSVCGSTEHPAPAESCDDVVVTQDQVAQARSETESRRAYLAQLERELETLQQSNSNLGAVDCAEIAEQIDAARARAISAENDANDNARIASGIGDARRSLEGQVAAEAKLATRLAELSELKHQLVGSLGDDVRCSVEEFRERVRVASAMLDQANEASERIRSIGQELENLDARLGEFELAELDLHSRLTATSAEVSARRGDLDQANQSLVSADPHMGSLSQTLQSPSTQRAEHRAGAEPRARLERATNAQATLAQLRVAFAERASTADAVRQAELILTERLAPSPFASPDAAIAAALEPQVITALTDSTSAWISRRDQLQGELQALGEAPDIAPDLDALTQTMADAEAKWHGQHQLFTRLSETCSRVRSDLAKIIEALDAQSEAAAAALQAERVAALVKGDNDHNTSLENWVLAAHLRDVVELANLRLATSTQQRFQLCVLDDGEYRRGKWGLDLAVEDTVTGTRRPTAGLSGGELFQASLALALGLADVVMNQSAGVRIDALFIDEGFGSLDETSVERVIDLLDDVRSRGALVGVITHVSALLDALPRGITVTARADGNGSTIDQTNLAA